MQQIENNESVAMMFLDREHQRRYFGILHQMRSNGPEYVSFAYLVSLVNAPIKDCFDFATSCIKTDMLDCSWITGTSRRVLTLAQNLWNFNNSADVSDVFSYVGEEYAEFMFYAIKIRFEYVPYLILK